MLNYELTLLRPDDTVSASFLSRKTDIPEELIESILLELAYKSIFTIIYIVFCKHYDKELVHAFEFTTKKELKEFLFSAGTQCPECQSALNTDDIRVAFMKKGSYTKVGEQDG
ncbi:hypothetical protein [Paenibacillus elgii]|uniref:hypothetical protein n=1 Tax=Paenibacillus elgii TaxID=189691 RepID=UPI0018D2A0DD|nr:hypothetical protein [Paenibacillus elgii]